MINQVIHINGIENHLICPMQCCLNGVHTSEVPKFLAESPSVTTHAVQLLDPFNAAHSLIVPLQVSSVSSYFDVYSIRIADNENENIPKIFLTSEELHGIHQQKNSYHETCITYLQEMMMSHLHVFLTKQSDNLRQLSLKTWKLCVGLGRLNLTFPVQMQPTGRSKSLRIA